MDPNRCRHLVLLDPRLSTKTEKVTELENRLAKSVPVPIRHANLGFEVLATLEEARDIGKLKGVELVTHEELATRDCCDSKRGALRQLVSVWNAARLPREDHVPFGRPWGSTQLPAPGPTLLLSPKDLSRWLDDSAPTPLVPPTPEQLQDAQTKLEYGEILLRNLPEVVFDELRRALDRLSPSEWSRLMQRPAVDLIDFVEAQRSKAEQRVMRSTIAVPLVIVESACDPCFQIAPDTKIRVLARALQGLRWLANQLPANEVRWRVYFVAVTAEVDGSTRPYRWEVEAESKLDPGRREVAERYRKLTHADQGLVVWLTAHIENHYAVTYLSTAEVFIARRDRKQPKARDWVVGVDGLPELVAHEVLHSFGARDEYPHNPETETGCKPEDCTPPPTRPDKLPNGNCACCATAPEECLMHAIERDPRLCAYTRAHVGIDHLLVEMTSAVDATGMLSVLLGKQRLDLGQRSRTKGQREVHAFALGPRSPSDALRLEHRASRSDRWEPGLVRLWIDRRLRHDGVPQASSRHQTWELGQKPHKP